MKQTGTMTPSKLLVEKHREFEQIARAMKEKGARRSMGKSQRGIEQHIVKSKLAILRWPTSYAHAKKACVSPRKVVRWEPLRVEVDL